MLVCLITPHALPQSTNNDSDGLYTGIGLYMYYKYQKVLHSLVSLTENGVPPSGNTRAVVGHSVSGRAPGVVRSKWRA